MELHYRENKKRQDIPRGATAYAKVAGVRNMRQSGGQDQTRSTSGPGPHLDKNQQRRFRRRQPDQL